MHICICKCSAHENAYVYVNAYVNVNAFQIFLVVIMLLISQRNQTHSDCFPLIYYSMSMHFELETTISNSIPFLHIFYKKLIWKL